MHTQTPLTSDEHSFRFISPLLVNPPLAGGSPSQGLVMQSFIVSLLLVEHAIERTVVLSVIWRALTLMWHRGTITLTHLGCAVTSKRFVPMVFVRDLHRHVIKKLKVTCHKMAECTLSHCISTTGYLLCSTLGVLLHRSDRATYFVAIIPCSPVSLQLHGISYRDHNMFVVSCNQQLDPGKICILLKWYSYKRDVVTLLYV